MIALNIEMYDCLNILAIEVHICVLIILINVITMVSSKYLLFN